MLATQSSVYSLPETHFFTVVYKVIKTDKKGDIEFSCLDRVFKKIQEKMNLQFPETDVNHIINLTKKKQLNPKTLFELVVSQYLNKQIAKSDTGYSFRWIEKTPNHAYFLDRILTFYPGAQFVNIIRNPIFAIYSRKNHFPYNKETPIANLAHLWIKSIVSAEKFLHDNPHKMYSLKYEDLVENPENKIRELCSFLGMEAKLELLSNYREVSSHFIHPWETWKDTVKSNNITNTNSSWRKNISLFDILKIQNITKNKMLKYGYNVSYQVLQQLFDVIFACSRSSKRS